MIITIGWNAATVPPLTYGRFKKTSRRKIPLTKNFLDSGFWNFSVSFIIAFFNFPFLICFFHRNENHHYCNTNLFHSFIITIIVFSSFFVMMMVIIIICNLLQCLWWLSYSITPFYHLFLFFLQFESMLPWRNKNLQCVLFHKIGAITSAASSDIKDHLWCSI